MGLALTANTGSPKEQMETAGRNGRGPDLNQGLPRPRQMSGRIFTLCKEAVYIPVLGS
jgi:hypothetical protein